jgi:NADH dehydrogenase/NADH:ubiquinone oxidoreductase subunit G
MSELVLQIDGRDVTIREGATILEAAESVGISIPTLCHHHKLEPYGGCRVCSVEVEANGRTMVVAACTYPAEKNVVVRTRSEKLSRIRQALVEMMLAHAPDSEKLAALAEEYGADRERFKRNQSFCIHCGLCVRYCTEVKKKNALGFIDRGAKKRICFIPKIAAKECWKCRECFPLCPTSALQAAFVLTEGMTAAVPADSSNGQR